MNFDMDKSLGFILNRTSLASKTGFNQLIKDYGISPEQWSVIFRVVQHSGISQKELADSTYKNQGNLTRMIDKLVEKEYLKRALDKSDRRAIQLFATDKSIALVDEVVPLSNAFNQKLTDGFDESEKVKLIELLNRVYNNIQKD
ncbi:MAG: MarR family winged helix-turn-helix transcriptional regulator [Sulfurovum sp.]